MCRRVCIPSGGSFWIIRAVIWYCPGALCGWSLLMTFNNSLVATVLNFSESDGLSARGKIRTDVMPANGTAMIWKIVWNKWSCIHIMLDFLHLQFVGCFLSRWVHNHDADCNQLIICYWVSTRHSSPSFFHSTVQSLTQNSKPIQIYLQPVSDLWQPTEINS